MASRWILVTPLKDLIWMMRQLITQGPIADSALTQWLVMGLWQSQIVQKVTEDPPVPPIVASSCPETPKMSQPSD